MVGKGRWIDNVFIERLWRSVKYEEVYLHAYCDGREAQQRLRAYFEIYNSRRAFTRRSAIARRMKCISPPTHRHWQQRPEGLPHIRVDDVTESPKLAE
jgi:integrase-like protein